ncbi:MAG: NADP-dependent 3-hydroxy acid dehydrogenase YdfG [Hydrocarboniphaga sp.]|uniref:SDR family oxidoreductase n=1 Tax=Hydrocarboniphaga sp. TaxID=2033016 RepID=UPI002606634C|nr:SDR family oxidoreductase [Hydrocarboniphaga sp.]MDB5972693.1 NADP-dependent 3-hydroxy acid dehydrogenase YdfG [Hydrocarboniphaga sp.]
MPALPKLKGQRVLITGAGSGLGRALAQGFAAAGWRVACSDVRLDAAQQTASDLAAGGASSLALALDVRSEAGFADVVAEVQKAWGGIDVLVNNAGVATAGTVADSPIEQWRFVLDINLLGCVRGARAVIPLMKAQGAGRIVNVASFAGIANPPALASYNVSKAAVISLSETLRSELAGDGIGVSVAAPSFFKTDLLNSGRGEIADAAHSTAPQMQRIVERLMDKASVSAADVAGDIFDAVQNERFLVITHAEARKQALIKRYAPEMFFRMALKSTAAFLAKRT